MYTLEEIRKLDTKEINLEIDKTLSELIKTRMRITDGLNQNHKISKFKKYIAQLKTVQRENLKN